MFDWVASLSVSFQCYPLWRKVPANILFNYYLYDLHLPDLIMICLWASVLWHKKHG
jgi:hypothetical protein